MRLTQWTDYTLRVLMYCAATQGRAQPVTITEVAEGYGISRSHLMKIVQQLAAQGLLETTRGRGGGMRLMVPASSINIGAVVRATETDFNLVECFDPATNQCRLNNHCRLKGALWRAMQAFLAVLDGVTLEDLMVTSSGASGAGSAARTVLPTVALPRNSALARRRKPGAAEPEFE
ncbi:MULTISPECIES: Rrf2 family transcriptional regulator [unclassified Acidovorax]|jgi:Rrf2 family nitric oxide-sensitive transcriptional repressor|uniref:RrF2 family transcriptional regulator n=1 Tax=unclassified Acidovorax TaxID=2684926 RepID=UPI00023FD3F8|nr:Rrf2 family transcriptional regulator [Acidovorax sp. NO-1]EHL21495.1 BadM/Rrf2 family transcriptional regulator [Acidovorax sp. NO-1]